ncbi:hypothetical protein HDV00_009909 [Rhizophlyctis rosea]|nr:hypothetical protein HDV00_009909 [Rhizophlyctis rosea]
MAESSELVFQNEREVKDHLLRNTLPDFPVLIADEWHFVEGFPNFGVGDLVFTNEAGTKHLVVEVKHINQETTQRTQMSKRRKVQEQIERYTRLWAEKHPLMEVYGRANIDGVWLDMIGPMPQNLYALQTKLPKQDDDEPEGEPWISDRTKLAGSVAACVLAAPIAITCVPMVLSAAGFTAGGVAAGSLAAGAQALIGNVGAASTFAILQSAGAGGAGLATVNLVAGTGATMVAAFGSGWELLRSKL